MANGVRSWLSVGLYVLLAWPGCAQQQTSTLLKERLLAGVTESTIYDNDTAVDMSPDLQGSQRHFSSFNQPENADMVNGKTDEDILQMDCVHTADNVGNTTTRSGQRLVTDLPQGESTKQSTLQDIAHRGPATEPKTTRHTNGDPITLPVTARTSSLVAPTKDNAHLTNDIRYTEVRNSVGNSQPGMDSSDQQGIPQFHVQLGTEMLPLCFNDKFCYQKCRGASSRMNVSQRSFREAIQGGNIACSKNIFYGDMCSCDPECLIYGDCCPDVFLHCWNITDLDIITSLINNTRNTFLINEGTDNLLHHLSLDPDNIEVTLDNVYIQFGSCRAVHYGLSDGSILLVGRCPSNSEQSLKRKCEAASSPLVPPVSARVGSVDVDFSNVHCALCHGVKEDQVTAFTTRILCLPIIAADSGVEMSLPELLAFIDSGVCNVTFVDRNRPCLPRPCPEEYHLVHEYHQQLWSNVQAGKCHEIDALLCSSYVYPFGRFRNPHCKKCLASNPRVTRGVHSNKAYTVHNDTCSVYRKESNLVGGIFLFLDITGRYLNRQGSVKTTYACQDNEVFDALTHECKLLLCPRGQQAYRGQCQLTHSDDVEGELLGGSTQTWTTLRMVIWSLTTQISCRNLSSEYLYATAPDLLINEIVINHPEDEIANITSEEVAGHTMNASWCTYNFQTTTSNKTSVQALVALRRDLDLATLTQLRRLPQSIIGEEFEASISSQFDGHWDVSFCQNATKYSLVQSTERQGRVYVLINSTGEYGDYPLQSLGYELRMSRTNDVIQMTETVHLCEDSRLLFRNECRVVRYRLNETTVNTSGLYVIKSGQFYAANDFDIHDDQVYVCSQLQSAARLEKTVDSTVTLVLNLLFSSISIMFLLSMVIIYCVFPSLRTLAGKMTASLAGTMGLVFAANMLSFVETQHKYACPVIAGFNHVALLSQFGWMSAIACNMALTFGPSALSQIVVWGSRGHFMRYNVIVYGVSMSIVLIPGILDFLHDDHQLLTSPCFNKSSDANSSGRSHSLTTCEISTETFYYPRYGYPVCAWFSGPLWARLAFVVVPFAISYIINIVCFMATLVGIHKSSKLTKRLGKTSSDRVQCVIYIKLSTAMGFTWLLSLLGNVFQEADVMAHLFTVLILLQGVFLFLAFMANKRVITLICGRFSSAWMSEQSSSGAVSRRRLYTSSTD